MINVWKEVSNYSGCTDFEQLQHYLNIIYKFQIQLPDFQTQHPVYLAKMTHLHQMAIQYYEYSTDSLIEYESFIEKQKVDADAEVRLTEKKLIESKTKIKMLQSKLKKELEQKDKFIEKVTRTQLIQCVYCDKVVTTDSQFDLHMQQYHKRELNKQEVDVVTKAIQNQLLTQQLSNKIQSQQQQSYLALTFQHLQQTKEQLSVETKEFINNTMNVEEKLKSLHSNYTNRITELEEQVLRKLDVIQLNSQKEEQMREQQVKERVEDLENVIRAELQKNKFQISNQRSTRRLMTSGQASAQFEKTSNVFHSGSSLHRGQTQNIKSLANLEQDELIYSSREFGQSSQQQEKIHNQQKEFEPPTLGNIERQPQKELSESFEQTRGQLIKQKEQSQKQSAFQFIKKEDQTDEEEVNDQANQQHDQDDEENIDYMAKNLALFHEAVDKQQNLLFEMLLNRSKGTRVEFTPLQKKYYIDIMEKNIASDIIGIEQNELKLLKKLYDEVTIKYQQDKARVEEKLQLYSFHESNNTEEIESRRATQFLNIRSRKNSVKHQRNASQT